MHLRLYNTFVQCIRIYLLTYLRAADLRTSVMTFRTFQSVNASLKLVVCNCTRQGESGAAMAAKRFEQQRQQELQQQVPLRQFDDCGCYATKMMTMTTTIPTYDCPCSVPESSANIDNVARIPPPPPPLLLPVGGEGAMAACNVCGRPLSTPCAGDDSRCRCVTGVACKSPYSRLIGEAGGHVTYVVT